MEKICSRCSKPFNLDDKPIKSVDTDGNPLRIDLCSMCELDNAVEDEAYKIISNMNLYSEDEINEIIDLWNKTPNISNVMMASEVPNAVIRMVKDNE